MWGLIFEGINFTADGLDKPGGYPSSNTYLV